MRVAGKDINDECQFCGEILQCELFRRGHGIGHKRESVAEMVRCQMEHRDKRNK